jgi:hypothetical protein
MVICALVGLGLAFVIVTQDALVHFGFVFIDYPDPNRPGHLKGVLVSGPELLVKTLLAAALLGAAAWLWRGLRRSDAPPGA